MLLTTPVTHVQITAHLEAAEAALERARRWEAGCSGLAPTASARAKGHIAAAEWLLDQTPSPISGKTSDVLMLWDRGTRPTIVAIGAEVGLIRDELFPGHPVAITVERRSWLRGIKLTLEWSLGCDDRNPLAV